MTIFLYTLKNDTGFAPNPFHGYCTLACCKPQIRAVARPEDWIVGITPKRLGHHLAYAMEVAEVLTFGEYFSELRFEAKKPVWKHGIPLVRRCGDNCYQPMGDAGFRQLLSAHYDHARGREDEKNKQKDLGGKYVIVAPPTAHLPSAPADWRPRATSILEQRRLVEADFAMRLILSRKGIDSKTSPVRYRDLVWRGRNIGDVVERLTKGKQRGHYAAHLDPDIRPDLRPRARGWKPVLGQRASAQGHLRNQGVGVGDLFLFWGLFRAVDAEVRWIGPPLHIIWGWLQVGAIAAVDDDAHPG